MKQEYIYNAKVTNIVDGDTIDVEVDLGFYVYHQLRLRLAGIDTPEMNSKILEERMSARAAKDYVTDRLLDKEVTLKTYKKDKFGRFLADVFINGNNVNEELLATGLAKVYK
jgi:micrococcal nuclease